MSGSEKIGSYSVTAYEAREWRGLASRIDENEDELSPWESKVLEEVVNKSKASPFTNLVIGKMVEIKETQFGREILKQAISMGVSVYGIHKLASFKVQNKDIDDLTGVKILLGVRDLDISDTKISRLYELEKLDHLERLDLSRTRVTGEDVASLKKLKNLKWLNLTSTSLSLRDVQELKEARPFCKIIF
jgi:hypothetical protein